MSTDTKALVAVDDTSNAIEYVPFGAQEKLKLTVNMVKKFLVTPTKSGKLPRDEDVTKFMMLCKARELNPWEGDAYFLGYDGNDGPQFSMITAHQALLKRAEACTEYDGKESGVTVKSANEVTDIIGEFVPPNQVLVGAWAKVYRKDRNRPEYARLNLSPYNTNRSRWAKDAAGMIVKCAEAKALRHAFPNKLSQMYVEGEHDPTGYVEVEPVVPPNGNGNGGHAQPATKKLSEELKSRAEATKKKAEPPPKQEPKPAQQSAPQPPVDEAEQRRRDAVTKLNLNPDEMLPNGFQFRYAIGDEGGVIDQSTGELIQPPQENGEAEPAEPSEPDPGVPFPPTWAEDRKSVLADAKTKTPFDLANLQLLAKLIKGDDETLKKKAIGECRYQIKAAFDYYKLNGAEAKWSEIVGNEISDVPVDQLIGKISALRNNAPQKQE